MSEGGIVYSESYHRCPSCERDGVRMASDEFLGDKFRCEACHYHLQFHERQEMDVEWPDEDESNDEDRIYEEVGYIELQDVDDEETLVEALDESVSLVERDGFGKYLLVAPKSDG